MAMAWQGEACQGKGWEGRWLHGKGKEMRDPAWQRQGKVERGSDREEPQRE